jgi:hypothetical protein
MKLIVVSFFICSLPAVEGLDPFYPSEHNELSLPNIQEPCKKKKGKDKEPGDSIHCTESPSSPEPNVSGYPTISHEPSISQQPSIHATTKPTSDTNNPSAVHTPSIPPAVSNKPSPVPLSLLLNTTGTPNVSKPTRICNDILAKRISLNNVATMRCRELNRLSEERRWDFCFGRFSHTIDAAMQCPDVCEGKCLCERNRAELDDRFSLVTDQYNMTQDLKFDADTNASRKCRYISTLGKNLKKAMCSYQGIQDLCPVRVC